MKFNFDIGEKEKQGLLKDGGSNVKFDVEFKALGDWQKLQPFTEDGEDITMVVFVEKGEKGFDVALHGDESEELEFKCKDENLLVIKEEGDGNVFSGEMIRRDNKTLVSDDNDDEEEESTGGKLWLNDCKWDKETVICDLKVVTEIKSFKS